MNKLNSNEQLGDSLKILIDAVLKTDRDSDTAELNTKGMMRDDGVWILY